LVQPASLRQAAESATMARRPPTQLRPGRANRRTCFVPPVAALTGTCNRICTVRLSGREADRRAHRLFPRRCKNRLRAAKPISFVLLATA